MPSSANASAALFARAQRRVPGGVNSPVRAFGAVGGTPRFMRRRAGRPDAGRRTAGLRRPRLRLGTPLLGHAHPVVVAAVQEAAAAD